MQYNYELDGLCLLYTPGLLDTEYACCCGYVLTVLSAAASASMFSLRAQLPAQMRLVCLAATGTFLCSLTKYSCRLPLAVPTASTALQLDQDSTVTSCACAECT